jgi:hypothetical protein
VSVSGSVPLPTGCVLEEAACRLQAVSAKPACSLNVGGGAPPILVYLKIGLHAGGLFFFILFLSAPTS